MDRTSIFLCGIDWGAIDEHYRARARLACAAISSTGVIVPSALDTWVTARCFVRVVSSLVYSSIRQLSRDSSTGITLSTAPVSDASICQGTMFGIGVPDAR